MNIVLTGLRGTGKSRIGEALARELGFSFIDIDKEIEREVGMKIAEFVKGEGWERFREIEKGEALRAANLDKTVIATGGGTIMDSESAQALKKNGIFVFLKASLDVLAKRIAADASDGGRPSLTGRAPEEELNEVWNERKEIYEKTADISFDVSDETEDLEKDVQNKAQKILELLKSITQE